MAPIDGARGRQTNFNSSTRCGSDGPGPDRRRHLSLAGGSSKSFAFVRGGQSDHPARRTRRCCCSVSTRALKGSPHEATVETLERSRIDFITRSDFLRVIDESNAIRASLTQFLTDELSDLVECVRSLILSQSAAERLAGLLLRLSNGHSRNHRN